MAFNKMLKNLLPWIFILCDQLIGNTAAGIFAIERSGFSKTL
jgi:hypothetical protein